MLLSRARQRDKARDRAGKGALTTDDLLELLFAQDYKCAVTGITLQLQSPETGKIGNPFSPSLDRLDNEKGYGRGNVQLVCLMYNNAKNRFTDDDLEVFCRAFLAKRGG